MADQPQYPGTLTVINGNGAVAHVMSHVCGGVIGYPITPSTEISELYEAARASRPDCDEVILWNERGELTEAITANVVLDVDGEWVTPPVTSGLLAGTFRNWLLAAGQIREHILTPADLRAARRIALINSVRKWQAGVLVA